MHKNKESLSLWPSCSFFEKLYSTVTVDNSETLCADIICVKVTKFQLELVPLVEMATSIAEWREIEVVCHSSISHIIKGIVYSFPACCERLFQRVTS
ncbi:hypothetical protein ACHAWO_012480 [Cyclotella atomus]|uniref:Uncharacterized protein n=1 Tax=Cyclotella atomus TaxID=382360 RepID=A0ABD3N4X8_9STRA